MQDPSKILEFHKEKQTVKSLDEIKWKLGMCIHLFQKNVFIQFDCNDEIV